MMLKLLWCVGLLCLHATRVGQKDGKDFETESEGNLMLADQWTPSPDRLKYVRSKMTIEHEVVEPFVPLADALNELGPSNPSAAKVAFLFLTMKDFPWADVWDAFFQDARNGSYSIYVHRAALKDDAQRKEHELPLSKYGAIDVPWVKTAWCALFGVEVASLYAAMQDPDNVQFVFVSDSTVPLKPFNYVYRELVRNSPTTSKICLASPAVYYNKAKVEFAKQEATRSCYFRDFLRHFNPRAMKHHQWAVFNRPHAKLIVKYAKEALDIYEDVWLKAASDIEHQAEGCSDEAVPLIALLHALEAEHKSTGNTWTDLSRLGVEQSCLTFLRWRNCFAGGELALTSAYRDFASIWRNLDEIIDVNFNPNQKHISLADTQLKREMNGFPHAFETITHSYLEKVVAQNFMFARKFHPGAQVTDTDTEPGWTTWLTGMGVPVGGSKPLVEVLPEMWSEFDWGKAQSSQWRRLEFEASPGPLKN